jgi:hypothetical protein
MTEHYKLGISEKTWTYIGVASGALLLATTSKTVANTIGKEGIFGYGKSKKLATLGKSKDKTWGDLQNVSLVLLALTMLESSHDSLQRLAQVRKAGKFKDIF